MSAGDHDLLLLLSAHPTLTTDEAERLVAAWRTADRSAAGLLVPTSFAADHAELPYAEQTVAEDAKVR